jgi:hypothetical protein
VRGVELFKTLMALSAGTRLGPHEILAPIGAGDMGEVYRARDPRMGCEVAIKISAERFSDRFSRELHAVAAVNHPNICHLYDVGPDYLGMELVEGPTLAERIKRGAVPLDEALGIAKQITEALEAAHPIGSSAPAGSGQAGRLSRASKLGRNPGRWGRAGGRADREIKRFRQLGSIPKVIIDCNSPIHREATTLPEEETRCTTHTGRPPNTTNLRHKPIVLLPSMTKERITVREAGIRSEHWSAKLCSCCW